MTDIGLEIRRVHNNHWVGGFRCDFMYRLPSGKELPVKVDVAWCIACVDFTLVERLRGYESICDNMVLLEWLNCLESRKSPQKCLQCGSVFGIKVLPQDEEIDHPLGGGRIMISEDETRFDFVYSDVPATDPAATYFDTEGNWIAGPRDW